jgi:hypothetical protein
MSALLRTTEANYPRSALGSSTCKPRTSASPPIPDYRCVATLGDRRLADRLGIGGIILVAFDVMGA